MAPSPLANIQGFALHTNGKASSPALYCSAIITLPRHSMATPADNYAQQRRILTLLFQQDHGT
jgi:hypothetical protein